VSGPVIRRAEPADAEALSLIGRATFLETFAGVLDADGILEHCDRPHSASIYAQWLEDGVSRLWIVEAAQGRAPVGYPVLADPSMPVPDPSPTDVEIKRIYLLSRFHGGGLGTRLMEAALAEARAMGRRRALLGVYRLNEGAQGFYRRHGFNTVGARRFQVGQRFYDDVVMARSL
jgi:ribosomal protein S18 acetylase RimI-like enzyme